MPGERLPMQLLVSRVQLFAPTAQLINTLDLARRRPRPLHRTFRRGSSASLQFQRPEQFTCALGDQGPVRLQLAQLSVAVGQALIQSGDFLGECVGLILQGSPLMQQLVYTGQDAA